MNAVANLLTSEAIEAIRTQTGILFDSMVDAVVSNNPTAPSRSAATSILQRLLLESLDDVLAPPDLRLPDYVKIEGQFRPIQITDPYLVIMRTGIFRAVRKSILDEFGGAEGMAKMRREHISEGGDAAAFDDEILGHCVCNIAALNARAKQNHPDTQGGACAKPWWKLW